MRRTDKEVKTNEGLVEIIDICKVLRIAVNDGSFPYIVPVNFGYSYRGEELVLYIHGAVGGKKFDLLAKNGNVAFEMDCHHKLVENEKPCDFSYEYGSVIGTGKAHIVEDMSEKNDALNHIMKHQCGRTFSFDEEAVKRVCVYEITVISLTGKKRWSVREA